MSRDRAATAAATEDEMDSRPLAAPLSSSDAADRDHLLDRLHSLRTIMPVFAQELASARRQAAALRLENRRLLERVQQLHHERDSARSGMSAALTRR
jgi:hypothetical protein